MHFTKATGAAALLALTPSALALGKARVVNQCGSNVYFASVAQNVAADMAELPSSGYEESYSLQNVGVSIKLAPNNEATQVTQFEFTWAGSNIFYDISNINGYLFSEGGMALVPSEAGCDGFPTCQPVVCAAGESTCSSAYNQPDDVRTMVCPDTSDLTMYLCPNGTSTNPSTPSGTSSSTPSQWTQWTGASKREAEPHSHGHRIHARHLRK